MLNWVCLAGTRFAACGLFLAAASAHGADAAGHAPRVVSLAPNLTEIVCAIGGGESLVGRTTACDYPSDIVRRVPAVGGFGNPSLELLLEAKPSLVLDVDLADETLANKIRNLGLRRERVACRRLDDIPSAIRAVGSAMGLDERARALAGDMEARIRQMRDEARGVTNRPRVYVEIWCDPLMTAGRSSFLSELVYLAGGTNVGDSLGKEYGQVSPEWVLAQAPDVILCLYMANDGVARRLVVRRQGWDAIPAVRNGRVFDGLDNNMILRPGPRVLGSIQALRRCIQGHEP